MILCPKCGQQSASDKVCSNCWTDLASKAKDHLKRAPSSEVPMSKVLLWSVLLIGFAFFFSFVAQMMIAEKGSPPAEGSPGPSQPK